MSRAWKDHIIKTTKWTLVGRAAGETHRQEVKDARDEIIEMYYKISHAFFIKQRGPEYADEYTQAFWIRTWKHWKLKKANKEKGRFRDFLYKGMVYFSKEKLASVLKKPSQETLSLDVALEAGNVPSALVHYEDYKKKFDETLLKIARLNLVKALEDDGKVRCNAVLEHCNNRHTKLYIARDLKISIDQVRQDIKIVKKYYWKCIQMLVASDFGKKPDSKEVREETQRLYGPER